MSSHTFLLDYSLDPSHLATLEERKTRKGEIEKILGSYLKPLNKAYESEDGHTLVYSGPVNSLVTVRMYSEGLITINIDYYLKDGEKPLLTLENLKELEVSFGNIDLVRRIKWFPPIRRAEEIDVYRTTTDERLIEYDVDSILYDEQSSFQRIQIAHSKNFGNMLILDDLINLAESDLVYTESLMCRGKENFENKDILILGGGDGALLYELRKEKPNHITMIDIDDLVMKICKVHLRSACGDVLDCYKKDDYEIIVGDCVQYMQQYIDTGKAFDYVFGDLTDIPISSTPQGEMWDFVKTILNTSMKVLKPGGKYMTHGNGTSAQNALEMYENVLKNLECEVTFTKTHAFVPSFMEDWVFYQVQKNLS